MTCIRCEQEISDEAAFCQFCGKAQRAAESTSGQHLRRSHADRQLAGVCGGIARYLDTDPVFVRFAWVVLTIVPGAIFFGLLAYLVAWLIIPEAAPGSEPMQSEASAWRARRLQRSSTDRKVGGVCGGIATYFQVDSTAIRLVWVVLSIFPGAIICGLLAYVVAWFIVPAEHAVTSPPPTAARATASLGD